MQIADDNPISGNRWRRGRRQWLVVVVMATTTAAAANAVVVVFRWHLGENSHGFVRIGGTFQSGSHRRRKVGPILGIHGMRWWRSSTGNAPSRWNIIIAWNRCRRWRCLRHDRSGGVHFIAIKWITVPRRRRRWRWRIADISAECWQRRHRTRHGEHLVPNRSLQRPNRTTNVDYFHIVIDVHLVYI